MNFMKRRYLAWNVLRIQLLFWATLVQTLLFYFVQDIRIGIMGEGVCRPPQNICPSANLRWRQIIVCKKMGFPSWTGCFLNYLSKIWWVSIFHLSIIWLCLQPLYKALQILVINLDFTLYSLIFKTFLAHNPGAPLLLLTFSGRWKNLLESKHVHFQFIKIL